MRIPGPYDERWDTPPQVAEYKLRKLSRTRVRWTAYKWGVWIAVGVVGITTLLDERIVHPLARNNPDPDYDYVLKDVCVKFGLVALAQ